MSAADVQSPCCPPNSIGYLKADYDTKGKLAKAASGIEYYVTGPADAKKAIILFPDVWGWNSGRTRGIADMLGELGYKAFIPKILEPPFEGGTDGDGLPPDFDIANRMGDLVGWLKGNISWDGLKPKIAALMAEVKASGVEKAGAAGFCFGVWAIAHTAADPELNGLLKGAAGFHPSIHLEDHVYGGNAAALLEKAGCPMSLMPAGNDPPVYLPDGDYYKALLKAQPASETTSFPSVQHGFVNRAELGDMANPEVAAEVQRALDTAVAFFAKTVV